MASYYASARSNYFHVRSPKAFDKFCEIFELRKIESDQDPTKVGFVNEEHGVPSAFMDQTTNAYVETEFSERLANQLAEGEVAIVMEIGQERMRYLIGYAFAVNSDGAVERVDLDDIYEKLHTLGKPETITPCEY